MVGRQHSGADRAGRVGGIKPLSSETWLHEIKHGGSQYDGAARRCRSPAAHSQRNRLDGAFRSSRRPQQRCA